LYKQLCILTFCTKLLLFLENENDFALVTNYADKFSQKRALTGKELYLNNGRSRISINQPKRNGQGNFIQQSKIKIESQIDHRSSKARKKITKKNSSIEGNSN